MKILVAGDFCDKNRVKSAIREEKYALMFDGIKNVVHQADLSIANFEFPIAENKAKPIPKWGPNLIGQRKAVDAIKYAGFNVCTLANNHILDQGADCCMDTMRLLEKSGIRTVGVGRNLNEAERVLYIEGNEETIAIINCCENEFSIATKTSPGSNPLNPVKQYYQITEARQKADYVLVIVHGGHEFFQLPSPRMKEVYQYFITIGADAVINHHQHCYSGYEIFNGKPIVYGLGNLLFDSNNMERTSWNEGYMVMLDTQERSLDFYPYIQSLKEPNVELMNQNDTETFFDRLERLNKIIANDLELEEQVNNYYESNLISEISVFEPYQGKILGGLFAKGFLPRIIRGKKILQIINHTTCESHLDKLHYALLKIVKR